MKRMHRLGSIGAAMVVLSLLLVAAVPVRAEMSTAEFRHQLGLTTNAALETWVPQHAAGTYAGVYLDPRQDRPFVYVGFTGDQEAQLAAFKSQAGALFAPDHIRPFPNPPEHSYRKLERLRDKLMKPSDSTLSALINSAGLQVDANKVSVSTEEVAQVRRLIRQRFGAGAPFRVEFGPPATLH